MRWVVFVSAVLAAGCGRFDFAPLASQHDAGGSAITDASLGGEAVPCTFGPFSTPITSPELSSAATDWGPTLSPDGLLITFATSRTGPDAVFQSSRSAIGQPWTVPVEVVVSGSGLDGDDPYLSEDTLVLYWSASGGIQQATRPTAASPWLTPTSVVADTAVYTSAGGADVSPDGLHIVFTATATADGVGHMFEATRTAITMPFTGAVQLPGLDSPAGEQFGSMTADGLEVVFQRSDVTLGLYHATRPTVADPFGAATELTELGATSSQSGDADISDDGTTLVFASTRPGGAGSWDLWFAARACL